MQTFTWLSALLFICYSLAAKFDYNRFRIMPEIVFKLFFGSHLKWLYCSIGIWAESRPSRWRGRRVRVDSWLGPWPQWLVANEIACLMLRLRFRAVIAVLGLDRWLALSRADPIWPGCQIKISWRLLRFRDRFRSRADVDGPIRHWQRCVAAEPVHRDMCQSPWKASARSSNMFDEFSRARSSTKLVEVRTGREHACHCKN